jgi:hypothetical protein
MNSSTTERRDDSHGGIRTSAHTIKIFKCDVKERMIRSSGEGWSNLGATVALPARRCALKIGMQMKTLLSRRDAPEGNYG